MKAHRIIMIISGAMLLLLFVFPIWNITLEAPQYPDPLGVDIWINKLADTEPGDIQNINLMNHYVGMKPLPESMPEFELFPKVVIGMSLLGMILGLIGRYKLYMIWFVVMAALGAAGLYDFYLWEYDYGHNLDPKAAIKFVDEEGNPLDYQPPLIGSETILNFVAHSWPRTGSLFLALAMAGSVVAFYLGKKELHQESRE